MHSIHIPNDFRRMNGAIKDVRFSFIENDFTFSAKSPWLGADTGHVQKTICFGQSFNGYNHQGKYIVTSAKTTEGCDSLYVLDLTIAPELKAHDSIYYSFPKGGNIQIQPEGGIPPYRYQWSNGEISANAHDLSAGIYQFTITDIGLFIDKGISDRQHPGSAGRAPCFSKSILRWQKLYRSNRRQPGRRRCIDDQ